MKKILVLVLSGMLLTGCGKFNSGKVNTILQDITEGLSLVEGIYAALGSPGLSPVEVTAIETYTSDALNLFQESSTILGSTDSTTEKYKEIYDLASKVAAEQVQTTNPALAQKLAAVQLIVDTFLTQYKSSGVVTSSAVTPIKMSESNRVKFNALAARAQAIRVRYAKH